MEKRKIIGNSLAILINRLAQSITTFILVASIGRFLGTFNLGQYTLAFTYYFLFMTLTSQGFKTLFTREISCNPHKIPEYLVNGTLLQFIFSIIGYVALVFTVFILPYSTDTSNVCYTLGLMIIPFSLSNITEAIFQAQEKMYYIPISTVPVYILRLIIIIWVLMNKYDLLFVSTILVISETLIMLIQWYFIKPFVEPIWHINWNFMWETFQASKTFIAIEGVAVLKGRMLVIILSLFSGEVTVGLFGALVQLLQPFEIIAHSLVVAVFPSMSKAVLVGKEKQRHLAEIVVEMLQCAGLPLIIGLLFIGGDILTLVYGNSSFAEASLAMNIVALGLVVTAFTRPLGYLLVANGFERINLIEVASTSVLTGLIGVPLISKYHLIGAAITSLIVQIATSTQYIYAVYTRLFSLRISRILVRPIIISILILIIFYILKILRFNIVTDICIATASYIFIVACIAAYSFGWLKVVWQKMFFYK
ncbi:polysaccharide biosynthesis protein [Nostoc sp. HK-01]|nr:polysaccharide biosynthesis protein [Nostoc sp. HK-01]